MEIQCCSCKKVRVEGEWVAHDSDSLKDTEISHGYCPSCADDAFREVQEYHLHNFRGVPMKSRRRRTPGNEEIP